MPPPVKRKPSWRFPYHWAQKENRHTAYETDSGTETNIIPTSLHNQLGLRVMNLQKPTMNLTAYGGTAILNLGSCQVYIKGPNNPKPQVIHAEVVDVDGPPIIGNISAQGLNLLRLNWAVTIESNSKSTSQSPNPNCNYNPNPNPKPFFFTLIKEYLLNEYQDVFTSVDCFPGSPYHIETNPDVSPVQLCTFSTPWGKYRWKSCLPDFHAVEMCCKRKRTMCLETSMAWVVLQMILLCTARVKQSMISTCWMSLTQHGRTTYSSTLTSSSLQEIKQFFGFMWTPDGLRADDHKIKAIRDMPSPQNLAELQTLMRMINYLNWFFSIMAQTLEPLRQLMKKDTPLLWQLEHHRAFQSRKQIITEAPVPAYYNPEKDNVNQSDASWLCTHARW